MAMPRLNGSDPANPKRCVRCEGTGFAFSESMFTREWVCIDCKSDEIEAPGYRAADEAVIAACRAGNFHFPGVGLSEADRAFLRGRLAARTPK